MGGDRGQRGDQTRMWSPINIKTIITNLQVQVTLLTSARLSDHPPPLSDFHKTKQAVTVWTAQLNSSKIQSKFHTVFCNTERLLEEDIVKTVSSLMWADYEGWTWCAEMTTNQTMSTGLAGPKLILIPLLPGLSFIFHNKLEDGL